MRKVIEVIPHKYWLNKVTGQTASRFGSLPWMTGREREQWVLAVKGWTWRNADGTIGLGRVPAETKEEAIAVMNRVNGVAQ